MDSVLDGCIYLLMLTRSISVLFLIAEIKTGQKKQKLLRNFFFKDNAAVYKKLQKIAFLIKANLHLVLKYFDEFINNVSIANSTGLYSEFW